MEQNFKVKQDAQVQVIRSILCPKCHKKHRPNVKCKEKSDADKRPAKS